MRFDPTARRKQLTSFGIKFYNNISYEEAFHAGTLGNYGRTTLDIAIQCFLVGLPQDGRKLLRKAFELMRLSLERRENYDRERSFTAASQAMASWLLNVDITATCLSEAVECSEGRFQASKRPEASDVQLSLTPYLDAQRYETLIDRYESTGLKKPKNIRRIQSEGTMCYVLARHRLGLEYSGDEITAALQTFLKRSVKEWLGRYGDFSTAAQWMKIAHWQPGDDPVATLLRCYDYLPGLKPPKYAPFNRR